MAQSPFNIAHSAGFFAGLEFRRHLRLLELTDPIADTAATALFGADQIVVAPVLANGPDWTEDLELFARIAGLYVGVARCAIAASQEIQGLRSVYREPAVYLQALAANRARLGQVIRERALRLGPTEGQQLQHLLFLLFRLCNKRLHKATLQVALSGGSLRQRMETASGVGLEVCLAVVEDDAGKQAEVQRLIRNMLKTSS